MLPFSDFVQRRYEAQSFEPDPGKPDEQIFAVSLESFQQLIANGAMFRNQAGTPLQIEAGFVERLTPDAIADHEAGRHYIVMHQALLATIIEFALFLFTQSFIMPEIGDAEGEESPVFGIDQPPGLHALRITIEGAAIDPEQDRVRIPKCEERHRAAIYMGLLMSRFVWFHELAHCINGHVLYLQAQGIHREMINAAAPLNLVSLKHPKHGIDQQRTLRHALEMDADLTAFDWLFRIQNGGAENIEGLKRFDDAQRFQMTVIGAYLMTWLFEEYQRFADSQHDLTHPAPRARLSALTGLMEKAAKHERIQTALKDVRATLKRLEANLPGFQFFENTGQASNGGIGLDALLEPYRFR